MQHFCPNADCTLFRQSQSRRARHCPTCGSPLARLDALPLQWPIAACLLGAAIFATVVSIVAALV